MLRLRDMDIICLVETWLLHNITEPPHFLRSFTCFQTLAVRDRSRGRGKGGIIIFVKEHANLVFETMYTSELWMAVRAINTRKEIEFILICVYLSPNLQTECCVDMFHDFMENLVNANEENTKIIVMGDFNARIGQLNQLDENYPTFGGIANERISIDNKINGRGHLLVETMEKFGFFVLNGRTTGDTPGQLTCFTYNGVSAVDLVWTNATGYFEDLDMEVENLTAESTHLICILKYAVQLRDTCTTNDTDQSTHAGFARLFWGMEKYPMYIQFLNQSQLLYFNSTDVEELYKNMCDAIYDAGDHTDMKKQRMKLTQSKWNLRDKEWFNSDCKNKKKIVNRKYRECQKKHFNDPSLVKQYITTRNEYRKLLRLTRRNFNEKKMNLIGNTKNSKQFWESIKKARQRSQQDIIISINQWESFYEQHYQERAQCSISYLQAAHPFLDSPISLEELQIAVKSCKYNKTPGLDGISNEYYKFMPPAWEAYILNMFNVIWQNEKVPDKWSITAVQPIYKKGDKSNPRNYRGIALINSIVKLFTSIIAQRLTKWADQHNILPEEQSGFRKGRGCRDNAYVLMSVINNNVRLKARRVFGTFVDFQRAFDSVQHNLLWREMHDRGVCGKILRILINIYEKAKCVIRYGGMESKELELTEGVLQGDNLSPLLFSLFIADMPKYFEEHGSSGMTVNRTNNIQMLMYADDVVLLSDSTRQVQKGLEVLSSYCKEKRLSVNVGKTVVVPFQKSTKIKKLPRFVYNKDIIDVRKEITYLGFVFVSSTRFRQNCNRNISRANMAAGEVRRILIKTKCTSQEARDKLFEAVARSVALYGTEVWGIWYLEELESILTNFYKSIFHWPRTTPNSFVRMESGTTSIQILVIRMALSWISKINKMSEDRLPKVCLERMKQLHDVSRNHDDRFNWFSKLISVLNKCNCEDLIQDVPTMVENTKTIIERCTNFFKGKDIDYVIHSRYSCIYRHISSLGYKEDYLSFRVSLRKLRLVSQLRLSHKTEINIYHDGTRHRFSGDNICTLCNLYENENLQHFLLKCPIYRPLRNHYLRSYIESKRELDALESILTVDNVEKLNNLYYFADQALKLKAFIVNE
jgi:hypothetical protein